MKSNINKSIYWGVGGGIILLLFYFIILSLTNSFSHAVEQLQLLWYWIIPLIVGFGIQVGLYMYIRDQILRREAEMSKKELAASAGISSGSMIACCAHHLVDVLPILGLSALFLFLVKYQIFFIQIGIAVNIIGILIMLEIIKKHALFEENGILQRISTFNLKTLKRYIVVALFLVLIISFFSASGETVSSSPSALDITSTQNSDISPAKIKNENESKFFPTKSNKEGGLSIEVTPLIINFNEPVEFEIVLNTHQGDLSFDLAKQSILTDDQNNEYIPLKWEGKRGGHHLSGKLLFPPIIEKAIEIKLIISDIYGIQERIFEWDLSSWKNSP